MICPKCGKSLVENSTICNFCGFQIPVSKENFIKQYKKDNYSYNIDKVMRLVIFIFFAWFIIGIILV